MNTAAALQFVKDNYNDIRDIVNTEYLYEDSFIDEMQNNDIEYYGICCGASKGVIIPLDLADYVIKIPFNYNDYNDEFYAYNYCELEWANYNKAKEYGVEDFFAEIEPLIDIDGTVIYVQTRVKAGLWNSNNSYSYPDAKKKIEDTYGPDIYSNCPSTTIALLLDDYSEEKVLNFLIFIDDIDINDLTENNIGIFKGKVKLFDYSGFLE